ncbi:uncharacterized protein LTR77_008254 [Saxophila tyrrhenica]|uniref:ASST-domain-containing protein n=1 Tax=Saxophila tyrrhenica TaxID=1690608 RepID=A0AAV9P2A5_9PEZI|nr:hypothetical protein LTR77_008254 [Saxophila tyrrhenica]
MWSSLWLFPLGLRGVLAGLSDLVGGDPEGFEDGHDLHHFVTRPELQAPRYIVAKHHPEAISPGYWFVTPYSSIAAMHKTPRRDHIPCQTGAHIYDGDGVLIWSGACEYGNRNIFNFRPVMIDGVQHFSFWLPKRTNGENIPEDEKEQTGVLMNTNFQEVNRTYVRGGKWLDGHEYNVLPDGKTLLLSTIWTMKTDASDLGESERDVWNTGFREIDMNTGEVLFEWIPTEGHVKLSESCDVVGMDPKYNPGKPWDWFHINSVDKTFNGDYIVSSRHTSTIYKISKEDGSIIWRLGGCGGSDFDMEEDLEFRWQHHARLRYENMTHTVISVFDNHGDDQERNPDIPIHTSAGKIMILDHSTQPMTAKMLRRFDRPDGDTSLALGNVQIIGKNPETASYFIDWAFPGYISEYDSEDRLVMEAKWMSERFRSYRAYKAPFVGKPLDPPAFKILPMGYAKGEAATAFYVSWNGATEVKKWAFYGGDSLSSPLKRLGLVEKHGFETSWVVPGIVKYAYAEAIGEDSKALGRSTTVSISPSRDLEEPYLIATPLLDGVSMNDDDMAPGSLMAPDSETPPVSKLELGVSGMASNTVAAPQTGTSYVFVVGFAIYGGLVAMRNLIQMIAARGQWRAYKSGPVLKT